MIVRRLRSGRFECVTQHDHGRMTGDLAAAWGGPAADTGVDDDFVAAARLHDAGWAVLDRRPPLDPATGLPHDFLSLPLADRLDLYDAAVDRAAEFDPWIAVMTSLHYSNFAGLREAAFLDRQRAVRAQWISRLPAHLADPARQARDLRRLQLLDVLSLWMLMTGPALADQDRPSWLEPARWPRLRDAARLWDAEWLDETTAVLRPWPFRRRSLVLDVPVRRPEGGPWPNEAAWTAAWLAADEPERLRFELRATRGREPEAT